MLLSPLFKGFVKESGPAGQNTGKLLALHMYLDISHMMCNENQKCITQMVSI